jgi:hypothetical protein
MNTLNRFFIFILLLALLYALWRYQQYILGSDDEDEYVRNEPLKLEYKKKSRGSKKKVNKYLIEEESLDNITLDNVSQYSLGSIEDIKTNNQDSYMDSNDGASLGFLEDQSHDSQESKRSFFFEGADA